ncbi:uncharacterized protein [Watersipora subatra]
MADEVDMVTLNLDDDNRVVIHMFGATVISWICGGKERLFLSSTSLFENGKAIRGGIPVVFPQFGPWKLGPQHGFARISMWDLYSKKIADGRCSARFILINNEISEAMWNYKFKLIYDVTISKTNGLSCSLSVTNQDSKVFDFTTLLHTYLKVDDAETVTVSNLQSLKYIDKLKNGEEFTESDSLLKVVNGIDRIYKSTPATQEVFGCVDGSTVIVSKNGLPDTVVWNPWAEKARNMSDFDDDGYKKMICVEPGFVVERVILQPQEERSFTQNLVVTK